VASFNAHCGVDGWGRSYDVVQACERLDADAVVLQESFTPDDGVGLAEEVGAALGYTVTSFPMSGCLLHPLVDEDDVRPSWGPFPWGSARAGRALELGRRDRTRAAPPGAGPAAGRAASRLGTWDLAVLTRQVPARAEVLELGDIRGDRTRRGAIAVDLVPPGGDGRPVTVIGTHMSHLSDGSLIQFRRLARRLPAADTDVVLAGDMNLWGPPLSLLFPGLRRVVRGRTWPAWRPIAQSDHILATSRLASSAHGEVVPVRGSDHLPVRARFALGR